MKYTTRGFKARVEDIIKQFEKQYPDEAVLMKLKPHKKNLLSYIETSNTSTLLYFRIEQEIKKMPYWFSKVGYLKQELRNLLKLNNQEHCIETDAEEKAELELSTQPITPYYNTEEQTKAEQLEKEKIKSEQYLNTIDSLEKEKSELLIKLNTEITNSVKYRQQIEDLLNQRACSVTETALDEDKQTIEQLQHFNRELMAENTRLSTDLKDIIINYGKALEINKRLQATYDQLSEKYSELKTELSEQSRILNNKLRFAQTETRHLKEDFGERIAQLEQFQAGSYNRKFSGNPYLHRSSPINAPSRRGNNVSSNFVEPTTMNNEKLSL